MVFTSTHTLSWSLRPGRIDTLSIRVGFVVKKRSNMCFPHVDEVTVCSRRQSLGRLPDTLYRMFIVATTGAYRYINRAYPGSEFVVANTLAKWKKLEPNDIDFSHLTHCQLAVTFVIC